MHLLHDFAADGGQGDGFFDTTALDRLSVSIQTVAFGGLEFAGSLPNPLSIDLRFSN